MKTLNPKAMLMAVSTGALLLILGTTVPANAQKGQHEEDVKAPEQMQQTSQNKKLKKKTSTVRQTQQSQAKAQKAQQPAKSNQKMAQPTKVQPGKQQINEARVRPPSNRPSQMGKPVQQNEQKVVWTQRRARSWRSEHRTWKQRGGYNGYRISPSHYRGYFGRNHRFRIYSRTLVIYDGYPCFQYGGYWFSIVDPWPEYWAENWYENDDVYIVYYDDGYYLYNRRHPGVGITINVFID